MKFYIIFKEDNDFIEIESFIQMKDQINKKTNFTIIDIELFKKLANSYIGSYLIDESFGELTNNILEICGDNDFIYNTNLWIVKIKLQQQNEIVNLDITKYIDLNLLKLYNLNNK